MISKKVEGALTPVYGGGPDSIMEPLSEHLEAYDRVLAQYFGMGLMACYRGFRLYDTIETQTVVKGWVDFYNQHRAILDSDIIHVRRPDGRDLDCMMHANVSLLCVRTDFVIPRYRGIY